MTETEILQARERAKEPAVRAFVSLMKLSSLMEDKAFSFLKRHGITAQQYNAMRIIRGAGSEEGLPCNEIGARMLNRVPDVPRLVARLVKLNYASRHKCSEDGRVVKVKLTPRGESVLRDLDEPSYEFHCNLFSSLSDEEKETLAEISDKLYENLK